MKIRSAPIWGRLATGGFMLLAASGCMGGYVVVESAPPPARVEVIGDPPRPEFVWVAGYWDWSGMDYVWVPGRWEVPPHGHHRWVPDSWERHGKKWRHSRGRWD